MKTSYCEKAETWLAKKAWREANKKRILIRATSFQQVQRCAIESFSVNKDLLKY